MARESPFWRHAGCEIRPALRALPPRCAPPPPPQSPPHARILCHSPPTIDSCALQVGCCALFIRRNVRWRPSPSSWRPTLRAQHFTLQVHQWWPHPSAATRVRSPSPSNPTRKPAHTSAHLICVLLLTLSCLRFLCQRSSTFLFDAPNMPEAHRIILAGGAVCAMARTDFHRPPRPRCAARRTPQWGEPGRT